MGQNNEPYAITLFDNDNTLKNLFFHVDLHVKHPTQYSESGTLNVEYFNKQVVALVDTGATICGISERMIQQMNLSPYRESEFETTEGLRKSPVYVFDVIFPKGKVFENIEAVRVSNSSLYIPHDFLIGMNILRQGDTAITSVNGRLAFSFRSPPAEIYIDFQKELNQQGNNTYY
jgi:predicted aspartyl protease